ncbi:hypothetical protein [Cohaesibacter haloalkalitolerans]|uniref:hypothetical protein n=1 Tax=Cohaesibacter haloalkalitolerans TaxID=1162980 RepID=UPI0013C53277|nr:hypothetical protein [Cohaesibacter haloalkalitolerans]
MKKTRHLVQNAALSLAMATCATAALADENEVYLGQTGVTNVIDINQLGDANKIGADDRQIFISQQGISNEMTISQTGYSNQAGARASSGSLGLQGLYQTGALNSLDITQENDNAIGINQIGAISQVSPDTYASARSNSLTIIQSHNALDGTDGSGDGQGNHFIGEIQQIQTATALSPNVATIRQYDGGNNSDDGNSINRLVQEGSANRVDITQQYRGNAIDTFLQYGLSNEASILQRAGMDNLISSFNQIGSSNRTAVTMTGSRNLLLSLIQNNDLVSVAGNLATVQLGGDDNGGDGFGGLGQFTHAITKQLAVAQAEIKQLGDDNTLNFVTSGVSSMTVFGFVQDGDGNWLSGTTDGTENEVAALQIGDGNRLNFSQSGDRNALSVSYRGKDNELNAVQTGNDNTMSIAFDGSVSPLTRSDQNNDTALGGFTDVVLGAAGTLTPGQAIQTGNLNVAFVQISEGSFNKFAFSQSGDQNVIDGAIHGSSNQSAVIQTGGDNYAYYRQSGNYNQLIILQ